MCPQLCLYIYSILYVFACFFSHSNKHYPWPVIIFVMIPTIVDIIPCVIFDYNKPMMMTAVSLF